MNITSEPITPEMIWGTTLDTLSAFAIYTITHTWSLVLLITFLVLWVSAIAKDSKRWVDYNDSTPFLTDEERERHMALGVKGRGFNSNTYHV